MFSDLLIPAEDFRWKKSVTRYFNASNNYIIRKVNLKGKDTWHISFIIKPISNERKKYFEIIFKETDKKLKFQSFDSLTQANEYMINLFEKAFPKQVLESFFDPKLRQGNSNIDNTLFYYNSHYPADSLPVKLLPRRAELLSKTQFSDNKWYLHHKIIKNIKEKTGINCSGARFDSKPQAINYLRSILKDHLPSFYDIDNYKNVKRYFLAGENAHLIDTEILDSTWWVIFTKSEIKLEDIFG